MRATRPSGDRALSPTGVSLKADPPEKLELGDALSDGVARATHLAMLEAIAGPEHVRTAYAAAIESGHLWHEFGDVHLIID